MRTIIAPLPAEVEQQLHALDRRRAQIARRYIRRLKLEPELGAPIERGMLADYGCRRIYFDRDSRPDDLFGARPVARRRGDQDLGDGPAWRIVYWTAPAQRTQIRPVVVLAVAVGHAAPPAKNAYQLAATQLVGLVSTQKERSQ